MSAAHRFARNKAMVEAALYGVCFDGTFDERIVASHGVEPGVLELAFRRAEVKILIFQAENDPNKFKIIIGFPDGSCVDGARDDGAQPQTLEWSLYTMGEFEQLFG